MASLQPSSGRWLDKDVWIFIAAEFPLLTPWENSSKNDSERCFHSLCLPRVSPMNGVLLSFSESVLTTAWSSQCSDHSPWSTQKLKLEVPSWFVNKEPGVTAKDAWSCSPHWLVFTPHPVSGYSLSEFSLCVRAGKTTKQLGDFVYPSRGRYHYFCAFFFYTKKMLGAVFIPACRAMNGLRMIPGSGSLVSHPGQVWLRTNTLEKRRKENWGTDGHESRVISPLEAHRSPLQHCSEVGWEG